MKLHEKLLKDESKMVPVGCRSSRVVLSGLLTGSLLFGSAVADAGEGEIHESRTRPAAASPVEFADYADGQVPERVEPESDSSGQPLPDVIDTSQAVYCPPACPPGRTSLRLVPYGDALGAPLHHLNFSGDCYGENWRTQNWHVWGIPRHTVRFHQQTLNHSLWVEGWFGRLCGKLPRGYIHDTSGHPMRSFFVPQPDDPALAYVPGSDTLTPPRYVIDYSNYTYQPSLRSGPACDLGNDSSGRFTPSPATAPR